MLDDQLMALLNIPVTWERYKRMDGAGAFEYHEPVVLLSYLSGEVKVVRDEKGEERMSTQTLYLDGEAAAKVSQRDRFTLPGGQHHMVLAIQAHWFDGELNMVEVSL